MLGFLLTQQEMFSHQVSPELPNPALDICHATAVPPIPPFFTTEAILKETEWFKEQVKKFGKKVVLGLQHPPLDATARNQELPTNLEKLRMAGIVFSTIAYQDANIYGGGFAAPHVPLTKAGEELLENMAAAEMILDLSHAGHQTARDAVEYIYRAGLNLPVVATHTGCFSVYRHWRNLPDDVLLDIRDTGGIVGIYTMTFGLHQTDNSPSPFIEHVKYAVELLGDDCVAVGSDGIYRTLDVEKQKTLFEVLKEKIDPGGKFGSRFPADPLELNTPDRMGVMDQLLADNFGAEVAGRIAGQNAHRFLSDCRII